MPLPGARINQYEMIKMLGEGGMGTVFLARDLRLGRRVAIKFLQTNQPELTQRLLVEARTTARCQHDNIVVIYEVGEHGALEARTETGSPFIVLEFLNGKPLTAFTEDGQRMPYARAVEVMCAVLRALECAHEAGIVHRDLKPDNIFVTGLRHRSRCSTSASPRCCRTRPAAAQPRGSTSRARSACRARSSWPPARTRA